MELRAADFLFEDAAVLLVGKPAGVPVHATLAAERDHFVAMVARYLTARDGGVGYLALVHRLDVDTSGVVCFARTSGASASLGRAFEAGAATKVYWALVRRPDQLPEHSFRVRNYLREVRGGQPPVRAVRAGGALALTEVRIVAAGPRTVAVEARPHTGRRHQIRVHLADAGLPILGDATYGGAALGDLAPRVMLHARSLTVPHPDDGRPLTVTSPLPPDFAAASHPLVWPVAE